MIPFNIQDLPKAIFSKKSTQFIGLVGLGVLLCGSSIAQNELAFVNEHDDFYI